MRSTTRYAGIIGAGGISETHLKAVAEIEGLEVAAIYGRNEGRVKDLSDRFGGRPYDDLDVMLGHQPLDIVLIGSPSGLHAQQGIAAAKRGIHVLTEKPVDISTERVDALVDECRRAGVKLGVFFQDRVSPQLVRLKDFLSAGGLGRILLVTGHVKWYRPPEYYGNSKWRGTWELDGGGALMNQGIHTADLVMWLAGPVDSVYSKAATSLHNIEVEDTVVATLEFESGALGTLEATTAAYPGYKRRVEITGTEGTVVIEHDKVIAVDLKTKREDLNLAAESNTNQSFSSALVSDVRGHRRIIEDFLDAIERDREPLCDGREGRKSVALVQAIYRSSKTGQPVSLNSGTKSGLKSGEN